MALMIEYHIKLRGANGLIIEEVLYNVNGGMTAAKQIVLNRNPGFTVWSDRTVTKQA